MPTISMFYGIIIRMYYFDNQQHSVPHIHVHYQDESAVIEIHRDELIADWELACKGEPVFKIEPLK